MAMTNMECINRLSYDLMMAENNEQWLLENDGDQDDLREVEKDIEAYRRAIAALEEKVEPPEKGGS